MTEQELRLEEIESIYRDSRRKVIWEARFHAKIDYYKARNARKIVFEENPFKIDYVLYDAYVLCQNFENKVWPEIHEIYTELCRVASETIHIREVIRTYDPDCYHECIMSLEQQCSQSSYPFKMTVDPMQAVLEEGKDTFDVVLVHHCEQMIPVIKETKRLLNLGLRDAYNIIMSVPCFIMKDVPKETALNVKDSLEKAGAVVLVW